MRPAPMPTTTNIAGCDSIAALVLTVSNPTRPQPIDHLLQPAALYLEWNDL